MSKDKTKQGKQVETLPASAPAPASAVQVEVSAAPATTTTIPLGSGIAGDPQDPSQRRPLTAKERLAAALLESPPETTGRTKDNPVFRQLDELADEIRDMKLGINGQPKRTTKQVCAVLARAKINCSTASLSNFYAFKGWTRDGKTE